MSADRRVDEHALHAYVDGALAPERRDDVEAYLRANPEAARRVEAYRRQNQLLRSALDPMLDEPVPPTLQPSHVGVRRAPWLRYSGIAAAVLAAGVLGWTLRGEQPQQPRRVDFAAMLAQRAVTAHLVYTPEVLHPVEVGARQEEHLVGWLSKRLGVRVRAPHLGSAGFQLVGGRLLPGEDRPAAQFMYQDAQGHRLTLYVATNAHDARQTAFRYVNEDNVSTFYWIEGKLGYALSGELDRERLLGVAEAVYRQVNG
jgi:anti-sigma factor RsiW